jgi:hypothetical protein
MDLFDKSLESPIFEELCSQSWKVLYWASLEIDI